MRVTLKTNHVSDNMVRQHQFHPMSHRVVTSENLDAKMNSVWVLTPVEEMSSAVNSQCEFSFAEPFQHLHSLAVLETVIENKWIPKQPRESFAIVHIIFVYIL